MALVFKPWQGFTAAFTELHLNSPIPKLRPVGQPERGCTASRQFWPGSSKGLKIQFGLLSPLSPNGATVDNARVYKVLQGVWRWTCLDLEAPNNFHRVTKRGDKTTPERRNVNVGPRMDGRLIGFCTVVAR